MDYITIWSPRKNVSHGYKDKKKSKQTNSIKNAFQKDLLFFYTQEALSEGYNNRGVKSKMGYSQYWIFRFKIDKRKGSNQMHWRRLKSIDTFFKFYMRVHFARIKDIKGNLFFISISNMASDVRFSFL